MSVAEDRTLGSQNDSPIQSQETMDETSQSPLQKGTIQFKKPPGRTEKNNTFVVRCEKSEISDSEYTDSNVVLKVLPFRRRKKSTGDAFNVNYEKSGFDDSDKTSEAFLAVNTFVKKKLKTDNFHISFNESVPRAEVDNNSLDRLSVQNNEPNTSPINSPEKTPHAFLDSFTGKNEEIDRNDSITFGSKSFDISNHNGSTDLSELGSNIENEQPKTLQNFVANETINTISSQETNEICSQESTQEIKKPELFMQQKHVNDAFDVGYEESDTSANILTPVSPFLNKAVPFTNIKSQVNENDISIDFDASNFRNDSSQSLNLKDEKKFFCKKSKPSGDDFEISFEKSVLENSQEIDVARGSCNNSAEVVQAASSIFSHPASNVTLRFHVSGQNTENLSSISNLAPPLTLDRTVCDKSRANLSKTSNTMFEECSSVRDNLSVWMSDHSVGSTTCDQDDEKDTDEHNGTVPMEAAVIDSDGTAADDLQRVTSSDDFPVENIPANVPEEEEEDESEEENEVQDENEEENEVQDEKEEENEEEKLRQKFKEIVDNARRKGNEDKTSHVTNIKSAKSKSIECEKQRMNLHEKPKLIKPAKFVTKRLYDYLIKKLKPKYGIDSVVQAEDVVFTLCEAVKTVTRRKTYQKKSVNDLKLEMAKHGIIETTYDFYEFVRNFLPYDFRVKVVPCVQPLSNIIYPPKDAKSPFDKLLER